jgi:hypothetical protein
VTYGFVQDIPFPAEAYVAMHAEIGRRAAGSRVEGLLFHVARPTDRGFQIIEVWDSKEQFQRYDAEIVQPVVAEMSGGRTLPEPAMEEFEPLGLIVPSAQVAV